MHNVLTFPTSKARPTTRPKQLARVNPFDAAYCHWMLMQLDSWKATRLLRQATRAERQGKYSRAIQLHAARQQVMLRLQRRHEEYRYLLERMYQ